ncbi:MAG TPA: G1 family glutamic endopeptidase [Candidatus Dormibacteraeota bacterium]
MNDSTGPPVATRRTSPRLTRALVAGVVGVSLSIASIAMVSTAAAAPTWVSQIGGTAGAAQHSASWAGYVVTARSPFTSVAAQWTVSAVSCVKSTSTQAAVQWVGFDGWYDKTVEQGGTEAYCSGTTPVYSAWWEMYPSNQITQVFSVRPGDVITASVIYTNRVFRIVVHDVATGKALTVAQPCKATVTCGRSSAEWIVEAPAYGGHGADLARWNQASFTHTVASVSVNPAATSSIAAFTNIRVTMTGAHGRRAQPGALSAGGQGFAEAWIASK